MDSINITGAREHNLKNISLALPRGKLVVITGVSGSGKSSLAFDTIFAEGQRRYMESLSAYARQFVEKIDKPDVDSIEGLSPAVSVDQKTFQRNPRSTVGTITEIYDFLRLLFARIGKAHCPKCGAEISPQSLETMTDRLIGLGAGERVSIFAPIVRGRKGEYRKELEELAKSGFLRVRVDGEIFDLDEEIRLEKQKKHTIELLIDVLQLRGDDLRRRIGDSLKLALKRGGGVVKIETRSGRGLVFSERFSCAVCEVSYPEISPRLFSFNSPYGACEGCEGLGVKTFFDPELIFNWEKSIEEGGIIPWKSSEYFMRLVKAASRRLGFSLGEAIGKLPARHREMLLHGSGGDKPDGGFKGVIGTMSRWFKETQSEMIRESLSKYINSTPCPDCGGARLRRESLSVLIDEKSIRDVVRMSVEGCLKFFTDLSLAGRDLLIGERVIKEIDSRLRFLLNVGLGYLALERGATTLSGGEAQRIRLATQLGSKLTGITYVLDEPTIGLHPRDNLRLIETLKALRDMGNTVIVVEHDEETMRSSDFIVDMGPGAGERGGEVVAEGSAEEIAQNEKSLTGKYLSGRVQIPTPELRRHPKGFVTVKGASENNLKNIDAAFPLGVFSCVTGVSGSGKSTLVIDTLYAALSRTLYGSKERAGRHRGIVGGEALDKIINIDQSPIGRTPRSNPATYAGLFTGIRELFSMIPEAKAKGFGPGRFSFNVEGGRCAECKGDGVVKIEMHFLPDVYVRCEACRGSRYGGETLQIRYKGKTIADALDMTVSEALAFFGSAPQIKNKLQVLHDVGLEYIRLGQAATTLSGGEAQRVKLSKELSRRATGRTLYILDEPTIGLHFEDVRRLIEVIQRLVNMGNTVIVIEHNLDVVKCADYLIDLGPEGGDAGGFIAAAGTPEEVCGIEGSHTGKFLRTVLK
ncbi:MAG: excinuclease ABC subunit UvrA [Deltaproteobacteria bacterium]